MEQRSTGDEGNEVSGGVTGVGSRTRRLLERAGMGAVATVVLGGVLVGGLTAAGAVGGIGRVLDDSPTSTTSTVPEETSTTVTTTEPPTTVTVPAPPTRTIDVPGVGQVVVVDGPVPTVVSVTALPGFTVVPDDDPSEPGEVHLKFFDASGGRIDVQAEFEDGALRVRVRDRRLEQGSGRGGDDEVEDSDDDRRDDDRRDDDRSGSSGGGASAGAPWGGGSGGGASAGAPWGGGSGGGSSAGAPSGGSSGGGRSSGGSDDGGSGRGRGGDDGGDDDRGRGRGGDDGADDHDSDSGSDSDDD